MNKEMKNNIKGKNNEGSSGHLVRTNGMNISRCQKNLNNNKWVKFVLTLDFIFFILRPNCDGWEEEINVWMGKKARVTRRINLTEEWIDECRNSLDGGWMTCPEALRLHFYRTSRSAAGHGRPLAGGLFSIFTVCCSQDDAEMLLLVTMTTRSMRVALKNSKSWTSFSRRHRLSAVFLFAGDAVMA